MKTDHDNGDSFADAFYAAYLTGRTGVTMALLLFHDGVITGVDLGEGRYDGDYRTASDKAHVVGTLKLTLPAGLSTITGVLSAERPATFSVPFDLPLPLDPEAIHRIETGVGPVNARFKKVRDV